MKTSQLPRLYLSISELFYELQLPTPLHPLIGLIDYKNEKVRENETIRQFHFDFYSITFKKDFCGLIRYGQGYYEFENGGLLFTGPRQIIFPSECERNTDGYTLFFHADIFNNYPLGNTISKYGFFSYTVCKALSLSDIEKKIVFSIFEALAMELDKKDTFSQDVIVSQIELLLNYSNRFYNRQYMEPKNTHSDLIGKMEAYLDQFFNKDYLLAEGLPTVQQVADHLEVSTRYLNNMLRSITGHNTQYHIHVKLIDKAKVDISTNNNTIAEIAYKLGFKHPQSFSKLFKQKTKQSPIEYRESFQ
ncbi:AraC family transcriptional regulator [Flavobacteriaceae bacterium CRH]|nr:AraC family transcriptional regulator [Flavobacteriaceae bacterium CRH]